MAPGGGLASRPSTQSSQPRRAALPPYQPPSCPLTHAAKQQLMNLTAETDYATYKKHLLTCVSTLIAATADSNEALANAKQDLEDKRAKRRQREARQAGAEDEDGNPVEVGKSQEEIMLEEHVENLSEKVERLTGEAERALRQLIDYTDELRAQDQLMQGVIAKAGQAGAARRQGGDADGDEEVMDVDEDEEDIVVGPTEIMKLARGDYERAYNNRTMANRYARNKDYAQFKEIVHEAAGETEPLPPPGEWFGADGQPRDRRSNNAADNAGNGDEDGDEDFVITGEVADLRCPITLQTFKEPVKNTKCKHVFEKSAIMGMLDSATVYHEGGARNRRGPGVKKLKCPQAGCDKMLEKEDFSEDTITKRMVRRQKAQEAREAERAQEVGEESEEDVRGRSQRGNRRETLDVDAEAVRVKKERMAKMEPRSDDE